jgi:endothelin-converting enzyme
MKGPVVNIVQKIGYQTQNPNIQNPQDLDQHYAKLSVGDNHFENTLASFEFGYKKLWNFLLKPTDRDLWSMTAIEVNAYYNPAGNEIAFPAGIMQPPSFSGVLPEYVSYGGFGTVVGHELTHAFDNTGAQFDEIGRYRNWWDNSTTVRFEGKTTCFVKQYSEYFVEGLQGEKVFVNGKLTLGENIADSGGLNAAFKAWKKREKNAFNPTLPGLEKFSNDQLFFLSFGNSWCSKKRKEALLEQVYTNPHSPSDNRILGPVANSVEFKKAFNCPVKEPTCELW